MSLQVKQALHQRLLLAPNITLALEVLRLPLMELRGFLERQLEDNPCLETDEPDEAGDAPEEPQDAETSQPEESGLDEEWLAHWGMADREGHAEDGWPEDRRAAEPILSLHDSLARQLGCLPLSDEERRLGEAIIQRLDDAGYLEGTLEELANELASPVDRLEAALRIIQRCEPPGIGARNLRECLLLQLEAREEIDTLAYRILNEHFPFFLEHRVALLAKLTTTSAEQAGHALERIKRLNPKPGSAVAGTLPPMMTPELIVHHREQHYDVELNDQDLPRLTISRTYARMLKDPHTPEDAKAFLAEKYRQANWLIKAIDERNATLLAIGRCLISLQRDFLERGPEALKPLTQAQVASLIGRHPSTVSRAIAGKTLDTPYGAFPLERLFASRVPQSAPGRGPERRRTDRVPQAADNGEVSDERIKSELKRLIQGEDQAHALSDAALVARLAEQHLTVARRTVAKYRTALKIPPAHLRRRRL